MLQRLIINTEMRPGMCSAAFSGMAGTGKNSPFFSITVYMH